MNIEFDEKGKFFTDIVSKTSVPVLIQTMTHRIHGNVYITRGQRLKDELNLDEAFLAITDATVFTSAGEISVPVQIYGDPPFSDHLDDPGRRIIGRYQRQVKNDSQ